MAKEIKYFKDLGPWMEEVYGKEMTDRIVQKALARYDELVKENADEPEAWHMHTLERIYPSIANFDAQLSEGLTRAEAAQCVIDYYHWRSESMAKMIQKLMKIPGLYKKIPALFSKLMPKMFGEDCGFKLHIYDTPKNVMRVDAEECLYFNICSKYGCPEIVPGFCEADDICYGNMHPKLLWLRTKTIGKGGDVCDFNIQLAEE